MQNNLDLMMKRFNSDKKKILRIKREEEEALLAKLMKTVTQLADAQRGVAMLRNDIKKIKDATIEYVLCYDDYLDGCPTFLEICEIVPCTRFITGRSPKGREMYAFESAKDAMLVKLKFGDHGYE